MCVCVLWGYIEGDRDKVIPRNSSFNSLSSSVAWLLYASIEEMRFEKVFDLWSVSEGMEKLEGGRRRRGTRRPFDGGPIPASTT